MRAILIDPDGRRVVEVQTTGRLDDLYRLLRCTMIEAVSLDNHERLIVDEEALLKDEPGPFFLLPGLVDPIAGRGLILGTRNESFIPSRISADDIRSKITWPDVELIGFVNYSSETVLFGEPAAVIGSRAMFRPKSPKN